MNQPNRSYNNWGKAPGFHSRPLDDGDKQALMVAWAAKDWDYAWGKEHLDDLFDPPLSRSTIYERRKELRAKWETVTGIDDPMDWRDFAAISRHGLGGSINLSTLRRMFDELQRAQDDEGRRISPWRALFVTYRSLVWWLYVAKYYGEEIPDALDRQLIGDQYAVRELASARAGGEFQDDSLEAWLRYAPWASADNEADYLKKTRAGLIPVLDPWKLYTKGWALRDRMKRSREAVTTFDLTNPQDYLLGLVTHTALVASLMDASPKPYLLPSQNVPHFEAKIAQWEANLGAFSSFSEEND